MNRHFQIERDLDAFTLAVVVHDFESRQALHVSKSAANGRRAKALSLMTKRLSIGVGMDE
jgi:hypothetical protein